MEVKAYGERGWLLTGLADEQRFTILAALRGNPPAGLVEPVLGYHSVLLIFHRPVDRKRVEHWLDRVDLDSGPPSVRSRLHRIALVYDGPDLDVVAATLDCSREDVIAWHAGPEYTVRMMGFAPGFPYLDGLDPRLHLERRGSPRDRIEPGTVAIGGPHAGIYPVASPGGWHLLGRTRVRLFKPEGALAGHVDAARVFLLKPGDRVQFVADA